MAKKKRGWSEYLWAVVPVTGLIMMIGLTLYIFGVPYGSEIAQVGGLWFAASIIIGIVNLAADEHHENKKKRGKKKGG